MAGLPTIQLGSTNTVMTQFGLGGEGVLRTWGCSREATTLIRRAMDLGVTYFESARSYAGCEGYLGEALGTDRERIFLTSKTAQRDKAGACRDLDTTLRNLRTEYVDLWQIHDIREVAQWEQVTAPGGALEAFEEVRQAGKVRFIGITGHHDPYLLAQAIRTYPFNTVLMPINVAEAHLGGFLDATLPAAQESGLGVIGMKVMAGGLLTRAGLSATLLLRWALTQPVSVLTVGCKSVEELEENVRAVEAGPLCCNAASDLLRLIQPYAKQVAHYRASL